MPKRLNYSIQLVTQSRKERLCKKMWCQNRRLVLENI